VEWASARMDQWRSDAEPNHSRCRMPPSGPGLDRADKIGRTAAAMPVAVCPALGLCTVEGGLLPTRSVGRGSLCHD
jgi:hypothetical protein